MNFTCLRAKERRQERPDRPRTRCGACFASVRGSLRYQWFLKQQETK